MIGLLDIRIVVDKEADDTGHRTIELEGGSSVLRDDPTRPYSDEEFAAADHYLAGVMARVACLAAPYLEADRRVHGCNSALVHAGIPGGGERLLAEGDDYPSAEEWVASWSDGRCHATLDIGKFAEGRIYFTVPNGRQKVWVQRLKDWLEEVQP